MAALYLPALHRANPCCDAAVKQSILYGLGPSSPTELVLALITHAGKETRPSAKPGTSCTIRSFKLLTGNPGIVDIVDAWTHHVLNIWPRSQPLADQEAVVKLHFGCRTSRAGCSDRSCWWPCYEWRR